MQRPHDDIRLTAEIFATRAAKSARKQQKGAARRAYRAKTMENTGTVIDGVDRGVDS
jgi:hypothetical protein